MAACSKVDGAYAPQLAITGTIARFQCCCAPQDLQPDAAHCSLAAALLQVAARRQGLTAATTLVCAPPIHDMQQSVSLTAACMVASGSADLVH